VVGVEKTASNKKSSIGSGDSTSTLPTEDYFGIENVKLKIGFEIIHAPGRMIDSCNLTR
jgi:hypothetical protein